jgi:hypothetical protein
MKKYFLFVCVLLLLILSTPVLALDEVSKENPKDIVSCFDYYTFGSVDVSVSADTKSAVSGTEIKFTGDIVNNNPYPIVDGTVYVKIFRTQKDMGSNGHYVVDQFVVKKNIDISASSSQKIDFTWQIPAYAKSGAYQVATFFTSADKFNLSGLSFTDDIIGSRFEFEVAGEQQKVVEFIKNNVKINGRPYFFAGYPPTVSSSSDTVLEADLINETDQAQNVKVVWKTYWWDAQKAENLLDTKIENISLKKGETKNLNYKITDKNHSVYYVVGEVAYQDTKSIIGARFTRSEISIPRINFPAITSFPLEKGTSTSLFSCLHNTGDSTVKGSLSLKMQDQNGKVFHEYRYDGDITSAMMGLKDDFIPKKNYDKFSIIAELSQGGKVIDSVKMEYDCKDIDPSKCLPKFGIEDAVSIALGLVLLFSIVILYSAIRKRDHKIVIVAGVFIVLSIGGLYFLMNNKNAKAGWGDPHNWGGNTGEKYVAFDTTINGVMYANPFYDTGTQKGDIRGIDKKYPVLSNTQVGIVYNVHTEKADGSLLQNGANLHPGDTIRFVFESHKRQDINWYGTGGAMDSPYGYWKSNLGVVLSGNICKSGNLINFGVCDEQVNNLVNKECSTKLRSTGERDRWGRIIYSKAKGKFLYANLDVAPPTIKRIDNKSGLTCGEIQGTDYDGRRTVTCTVNETLNRKTITPEFQFGSTEGKFYVQWGYGPQLENNNNCIPSQSAGDSCKLEGIVIDKCNPNLAPLVDENGNTVTINIPAKAIPYSFDVLPVPVVGTNAPVPYMTENVSNNHIVGSIQNFSFGASDVDGGNLFIDVDWDGNGTSDLRGTASPTGALNSSRTWTTSGPKKIYVKATDSTGISSVWVEYTVTISTPPPPPTNATAACSADNTKINFNWTNALGYNTIYFRANNITDYGYVGNAPDGDNLWNENVTGGSYSLPIKLDKQYVWWIHTKNTTTGDYSRELVSGGPIKCPDTPLVLTRIDGKCGDLSILSSCENTLSTTTAVTSTSWKCGGLNGGSESPLCTLNTGNANAFSISCTANPPTINVGSSTLFSISVLNEGNETVNVSWNGGPAKDFDYSTTSPVYTASGPQFFSVNAHEYENDQDASDTCRVDVVDPYALKVCEKVDGVTLKAGESRNFYSARISKTCTPYPRPCPPEGGILDGNLLAKFKGCVEPGVTEF